MDADKEDPRITTTGWSGTETEAKDAKIEEIPRVEIPRVRQLQNERNYLLDRLAIVNRKIELIENNPEVAEYAKLERK